MSAERQPWSYDLVERGEDGMRAPDPDLAYEVRDYDNAPRARFRVGPDAARYVRDRNREDGIATEVGDAHGEIEQEMRSRLDGLAVLIGTAEGKGEGWADPDQLEALGVMDKHATEGDAQEEAEERLREYPLAVETTMTFEVVIGTGGPDDRLLFECSGVDAGPHDGGGDRWEINRVLYRYSWSGSAERELTGEDRKTAEELARRVVPELAE